MINKRLAKMVSEWLESGSPAQESFDWSRSRTNWSRDIPKHKDFIKSLPDAISRKDVRRISERKSFDVVDKFLATMIWGYGDLGYGSYRVNKMFLTPGFREKIETSYGLASEGKTLDAYQYLSKNRVSQLGPAFGTKWLSFASPKGSPAPIYDSFIAKWVEKFAKREFANVSTSSEVWSLKTYATYFDWMALHSDELGLKPDDLELVIFQDATTEFSEKSKWKGL
jgi:hypothetical protein